MAEDDHLERVLRGLERAREFAKSYRFQMTDEYRALIAQVEALPRNQTGADKSGVWPAMHAYIESFKRVVPASRS
jgi:hypothetical protein